MLKRKIYHLASSNQHQHLPDELVHYYEAGYYHQDVSFVTEEALAYIRQIPSSETNNAVVLDIDETCLSNWQVIDLYKPYDATKWHNWICEANAPAITATLDLYKAIIARGFSVFFVTGRTTEQQEATEANLKKVGYTEWKHIFYQPDEREERSKSLVFPEAASYKTAARWSILSQGYRIVLNMGDQLSDVLGGFSEKTFQLPNPFYTII